MEQPQTRTVGILAHVDAGKTTLSEQILYQSHTIRQAGRVDHQDSFLDTDSQERSRGITIFSGHAPFSWQGAPWYLIDTPGHVDFSPEMERCLWVLDAAVVVVSAVEGVQGHTETIWKLLREKKIPTFFFINKTDRAGADPEGVKKQLENRFHTCLCRFSGEKVTSEMAECAAGLDDVLLERYLSEEIPQEEWPSLLAPGLKEGKLCPFVSGSALAGEGVSDLLTGLCLLVPEMGGQDAPFSARVFQIRRDAQGNRLAFLRVTGGSLSPRDVVDGEKVSELRQCSGKKYTPIQKAVAGELCAAAGLSSACAGKGLGAEKDSSTMASSPMLRAAVEFDSKKVSHREMLADFRVLEDEEPSLHVEWIEALQEIQVRVMGSIQLEILREQVRSRFSREITFGPCRVIYQETIATPVEGRGHFEPLRHYAEVHLRLEPGKRGSGIQFESQCSTDSLALNWQRLIETHVYEKEHKGVLTGSPITDIKVVLLAGRSHEKHTEGGDFREAVYRAIRQGLMKAQSILLEPWYGFRVSLPIEMAGRFLSDIQRMGGSAEAPLTEGDRSVICGRAPVEPMMDYPRELTGYTRGRGNISLWFDGYEPCRNQEQAMAAIGYDAQRDVENPAGSVFCSHGAGFFVPWDEADKYMHLP